MLSSGDAKIASRRKKSMADFKKMPLNNDQGRRRRISFLEQARRNKLHEALAEKRRLQRLLLNPHVNYGHQTSLMRTSKSLNDLSLLNESALLHSDDQVTKSQAIYRLAQSLSHATASIQDIINMDVLPTLITLIASVSSDDQCLIFSILSDLAAHDGNIVSIYLEQIGCFDTMLNYLKNPGRSVQRGAIAVLANLAGHNDAYRQRLVDHGFINCCCTLIAESSESNTVELVAWAMMNVCRENITLSQQQIVLLATTSLTCLKTYSHYPNIVQQVLWTLLQILQRDIPLSEEFDTQLLAVISELKIEDERLEHVRTSLYDSLIEGTDQQQQSP